MPTGYEVAEAFWETLLQTEHLPPAELQAYQSELLEHLLHHAKAQVPFYRDHQLPKNVAEPSSPAWLRVPTIDRTTLAAHSGDLRAQQVPRGHGRLHGYSSGGTTGAPVRTTITNLESIGRVVTTFRMFTAHRLDLTPPLFMIRHKDYSADWTDAVIHRKWGHPWLPENELGDRIHLDIEMSPSEQLDRLLERAPAYINTLPSNILRLELEQARTGTSPCIPVIVSVAEYLPREVAERAATAFGSRVINILSSAEAGVVAVQCPDSDKMHIQSELVLAEILNEDGLPCKAGEVGELVVTPLYNYAMPLIRYRSGDFVIRGNACPCGRSLPTIERFVGRKEHLFQFPDGSRALPQIDRVQISELIGHDAWQLVQTSRDGAELRYEPSDDMPASTDAVRTRLREGLNGLSLELREVAQVPKTSGGKRHFTVNACQ